MSNLDKDSSEFLKHLTQTSQMDQAEEGAKNLAAIVRTYQRALMAEAFNSVEALTLTLSFQQSMLMHVGNQGK